MEFSDLPLSRLRDLSELTATVASAYEVGIFRALGSGAMTAEDLARELDLRTRPVGIVLAVLEDLGLMTSTGGTYSLTDEARRTLSDPESEDFAGGGLPHWLGILRAFTRLPEALAHGGPIGDEEEVTREQKRAHLERFMAAMAAAPEERVDRIVEACLARHPEATTALDLGGGPGHMARVFADRGLATTLFDQPETVEFVSDRYGLNQVSGLSLAGGDFTTDPLPVGPFDVVLMSNIIHIYSPEENRRLLKKVAGVVAPGGIVAIVDFFRGRSSRAERFALIMLLKTEGGNTYSEEELAEWTREAGLMEPSTVDLDPERQLMTVRRPGDEG